MEESELIKKLIKSNYIHPKLGEGLDLKPGLRNKDGSGVLAGLTKKGDVHGFIMDEGEKVPQEGRLRYCGYNINDLVKRFTNEKRHGFEEICYLLLFNELPNKTELESFNNILAESRDLPPYFMEDMILKSPSSDVMNKLGRSVLALYSSDSNPDDNSIHNVLNQSIRLIAGFPTLVAYGYQAKSHYHDGKSLVIHKPSKELSTAENLLHMIRADKDYSPLEADILDLALVLHAEHGGGNNSTFTVREETSSGTDTYSAISAGTGSLKGPKHGGANIRVMAMMDDIKLNVSKWNDEKEIKNYLGKIIKKEAHDKTGLIYGLGHAVYTLSDPRAVILKAKAAELAKEKNREDEFDLYQSIEKLAPHAFKEVKKNGKVISPNVDFYSGFVYDMLKIPKELYTPLFAVARVAGWCAHRLEKLVNMGPIIRPAYKNVVEVRDIPK